MFYKVDVSKVERKWSMKKADCFLNQSAFDTCHFDFYEAFTAFRS